MKGLYLSQVGHIVNALPPVDINGGVTADRFNLKRHNHATIIVAIGVSAAAFTKIIVNECDADTGGNSTAIAFDYAEETTANGDVLGAKQTAAAAGVTPSGNDNIFYAIELDAAELTDGYPWVEVSLTNTSGNSVLASVVAVLSGGDQGSENATAIA